MSRPDHSPPRAVAIREMDRARDRRGVAAIDTAFETSRIYELAVAPHRIELVERALAAPLTKRYPIEDAFAPWASWQTGFVAEAAGASAGAKKICGFAAVEYEAWHARLVLWHLYVSPDHRRKGVARALLARVEQHGRELGARRVWLETSNVNLPGIAAYARLGYTVCGVDATLYEATPAAAEQAIYLSKLLADPVAKPLAKPVAKPPGRS